MTGNPQVGSGAPYLPDGLEALETFVSNGRQEVSVRAALDF